MTLTAGKRLGPYEIADAIGAGGMGEVYRALDTRLERTVAIKILPGHLSSDAQRRERFQREAKAISALSHPNICSLFDVGEQDGTHYLVLEYIEGESLADRLRKGPLTIAEALKVGAEIASALDAAHRRGIVHRDLKPGNVMLTKSGAKLLDFGLAKPAVAAAAASADAATLARSLTEEGTIVGTFQYMAPEQLEGAEADARSDIFGLGAILYEMAAGQPAFAGKSRVSLIASILSSEPKPITEVAPLSTPAFAHLVRTCLEKDPEQRFQSAHDVLVELKWVGSAGSQMGAAPVLAHRNKLRFRAAWAIAAVSTAALLAVAAAWLLRPAPAPLPAIRAFIQPAKASTFSNLQLAISPDGTKLIYQQISGANHRLMIETTASGIAQPISDSPKAQWPMFSPDGKFVAFCDETRLQKFDVAGGQVITIADVPGCLGGTWNADGAILVRSSAGIMQVSAGGGTPSVVLAADKNSDYFMPSFLPDGRHFVVAVRKASAASGAFTQELAVADLQTHAYRSIVTTGAGFPPVAQYVNGFLVYRNQDNLMARPFNPRKLAFTGDAIALGPIDGLFATSPTGVLAYFAPGERSQSQIRWLGRSGQQLGNGGPSGRFDNVRLSPDGARVAYQLYNDSAILGSIWVYDSKRDVSARITFEAGANDDRPVWSPDAKYILYHHWADRSMRKSLASGLGGEEVVLPHAYPDDWSSDGRYVAYDTDANVRQIGIYDVAQKKGSVLFNLKSSNRDARFSPDGKFLAYTSDESGQEEIYVVPFPSLSQKWRVSTEGGTRATWRRDGKELFYLAGDQKLVSVPVSQGSDALSFGTPVSLFVTPFELSGNNVGRPFDVSPDGQKIIANVDIETTPQPLTIVSNWTSLLKK